MTDWIAAALLTSGGAFCAIAGLGVVRFGDVFMRMHAATKAGTLGLGLVCLAAAVEADGWVEALEALSVFLFMLATAPVGAHLIGRAAFRTGIPVAPSTTSDADCATFRADRPGSGPEEPGNR